MKDQENTNTQSLSTLNLKKKSQSLIFEGKNFAESLKKLEEELSAATKDYCARYGFSELSIEEAMRIRRAEAESKECEGCSGEPCRKESNPLSQLMILNESGKLRIMNPPCKYGELKRLRQECFKARIPSKYVGKTFNDYESSDANKDALRKARWYVAKHPSRSLYLYGACGTGKTFLAALIAQEYIREYRGVIFGDVPTLLDEVKRTFNGQGDAQAIIDGYGACDLLILDDFGAGQVTEWSAGVLYRIINRRYNARLPTVITSNFDYAGLEERLTAKGKLKDAADAFTSERIISRLNEMCIPAFLGTLDRRKQS